MITPKFQRERTGRKSVLFKPQRERTGRRALFSLDNGDFYLHLLLNCNTEGRRGNGLRWSEDYRKDACYPRYCSTSSSQSR